jgi:AbrB family looped-hinge helix DNA binding protein
MTTKGRVTIPIAARTALGLRTGDRVSFAIRADGTVELCAEKIDLLSLRGVIKTRKQGITVARMNEIIRSC